MQHMTHWNGPTVGAEPLIHFFQEGTTSESFQHFQLSFVSESWGDMFLGDCWCLWSCWNLSVSRVDTPHVRCPRGAISLHEESSSTRGLQLLLRTRPRCEVCDPCYRVSSCCTVVKLAFMSVISVPLRPGYRLSVMFFT